MESKDNRVPMEWRCKYCGHARPLRVNPFDIIKWRTLGVKIQDAFPYLTAGERELIQSGTCESCWDEMFPEVDDEADLPKPKQQGQLVIMRFNMN